MILVLKKPALTKLALKILALKILALNILVLKGCGFQPRREWNE
jgi:hypothetical protein